MKEYIKYNDTKFIWLIRIEKGYPLFDVTYVAQLLHADTEITKFFFDAIFILLGLLDRSLKEHIQFICGFSDNCLSLYK